MAQRSFASVHNGPFRMVAAKLTPVGPCGVAERSVAHRRARATRWRAREPTAALYGVYHVPCCGATRIMARASCAGRAACPVLMLPGVRHVPCMPRMYAVWLRARLMQLHGSHAPAWAVAGRLRRTPAHRHLAGLSHAAWYPTRPGIPHSIGIPHSLHSLVGGGGQGAHSILQASHRKSHPRSSS